MAALKAAFGLEMPQNQGMSSIAIAGHIAGHTSRTHIYLHKYSCSNLLHSLRRTLGRALFTNYSNSSRIIFGSLHSIAAQQHSSGEPRSHFIPPATTHDNTPAMMVGVPLTYRQAGAAVAGPPRTGLTITEGHRPRAIPRLRTPILERR